MTKESQQPVLFEGLADRPVQVDFDGPAQSSDGGAILLKSVDERLQLTQRMASAVEDNREEGKVRHSLAELFRQRIFSLACGYPDCNDVERLGADPVLKLLCDRSPVQGDSLASQPTLSRFENAPRRTDLLRLAYALTETVLETQRRERRARPPRRITVDLDPTEDRTHGGQQLTFFNAFYDSWCYLPMVPTVQFDEEAEQFVVAPVLRGGNAPGALGAIAVLKRLLPRLREAFPGVRLRARMDGAYATPAVLAWLEAREDVEYLINVAKNSVLQRRAERWMKRVRRRVKRSGRTETLFGEVRYRAGRWQSPRRVIVKAEVTVLEGRPPRDNPRFLVTNSRLVPKAAYAAYADRGDMENRIKELKLDLGFDRTSCSRFSANQFRNLLTAAAYVLFQHLRQRARGTECERERVSTLRERLIKIGVLVFESVRRIVLKAPEAFPWKAQWSRLAYACGALSG